MSKHFIYSKILFIIFSWTASTSPAQGDAADSAWAILTFDTYWSEFSTVCGTVEHDLATYRQRYNNWAMRNKRAIMASTEIAILNLSKTNQTSFNAFSKLIKAVARKHRRDILRDYENARAKFQSRCVWFKTNAEIPSRIDVTQAMPLHYKEVLEVWK